MPWRRTPLRRGHDVVQAWFTLVVVMAMLLVAPWVAWWAASTTYLAEMRASAWERQHRHAVPAVLERDAVERSADGGAAAPGARTVPVPARWTGPDGAVRWGTVSVAAGARAGSTVTVWVDRRGTVAAPPRQRNPVMDASVAAMLAVAALTAFLGGVRHIVVRCLDRCRMRSWEAEWLIVGPRWSRR
jgi:hypothetical protein